MIFPTLIYNNELWLPYKNEFFKDEFADFHYRFLMDDGEEYADAEIGAGEEDGMCH